MFEPLVKFPLIPFLVFIQVNPFPMKLIILPLTNVNITISVIVSSLSIAFVVTHFALIDRLIDVLFHLHVFLKLGGKFVLKDFVVEVLEYV